MALTGLPVLLVPLLIIPSLQLPMREKVGLVGVFAIGALSAISSATRYSIIYKFITHPPMTPAGLKAQLLWSLIELLAAILAFSLPACRVFIKRRAKARTEKGTTTTATASNPKKKQTVSEGNIYIRHDIDVKSLSGSSNDDLELANLRSGTSHEELVHPQVR